MQVKILWRWRVPWKDKIVRVENRDWIIWRISILKRNSGIFLSVGLGVPGCFKVSLIPWGGMEIAKIGKILSFLSEF